MSGDRFQISYSKITSFDRCRKQYWYQYLSGLPRPEDPMNPEGIIGTGVHRAMRVLCETGEAVAGARELETYLRMPAHEVAGPGTEPHTSAFRLFEQGCAAHDSIESEDRWAELSTWIHPGSVAIFTRIDRADRLVGGGWQIVDWKTGRSDFDEATDQQLDIGHIALRTALRLPREADVTAVGWNLRTGRKRVRALTRDDGAATARKIASIARRMQAVTEFVATPSPACRFCAWRDQCAEAAYVETGDYDWLDPDDLVADDTAAGFDE